MNHHSQTNAARYGFRIITSAAFILGAALLARAVSAQLLPITDAIRSAL